MPNLTPNARSLNARIAANTRWANEPDWVAATKPLREGRDAKFRAEAAASAAAQGVTLTEAKIEQRAILLRRVAMLRLAAKSAQVRAERAKKTATD